MTATMAGEDVVAVLIPTHNRKKSLEACLASLFQQEMDGAVSVTVFDDASRDGTSETAERLLSGRDGRHAVIRHEGTPVQVARARNELMKKADKRAAFVLFLDDDATLESDTISRLVSALKTRSTAGACGPRIVRKGRPDLVLHTAGYVHPWTARYTARHSTSLTACDWLNTTCILFRREAIDAVEGFWPGFVTAHEDVDIGLQIKEAGYDVLFEPDAVAYHDLDPSGGPKRERLYYLYRNKQLLIRRRMRGLKKWTCAFASTLGLAPALAESMRHHGGVNLPEMRRILRAYRDGWIGRSGPETSS